MSTRGQVHTANEGAKADATITTATTDRATANNDPTFASHPRCFARGALARAQVQRPRRAIWPSSRARQPDVLVRWNHTETVCNTDTDAQHWRAFSQASLASLRITNYWKYVYAACKTNVHAELSKVVMQGKTCIMNTAVEQLQRPRTCHAVQISIQRLHMECGMHAVMGSAYLPPHLNNRKEYIQRERERVVPICKMPCQRTAVVQIHMHVSGIPKFLNSS